MCATCFTSVGNPICIPPASSCASSSLTSFAWFLKSRTKMAGREKNKTKCARLRA
ncbi:hypothetical protein ZOSMA_41G00730 [Zostera marina]|uniref:Uncharacterized protein n=1 Tax=Zostera marina TaxID=29655 RepID=A0A0K9P2N5_ZOSMR|nr:hypothetical protein ZOSMA_41G00730 [Zostera marina]